MDIMLARILELLGEEHGSTKALADVLGVTGGTITNWKSGTSRSYPKYAPQIAEYYGVSLDWLSGNSDQKEKPVPSEGYELSELDLCLINALPKMTVQEKKMLLAQIEAYQKMKE